MGGIDPEACVPERSREEAVFHERRNLLADEIAKVSIFARFGHVADGILDFG